MYANPYQKYKKNQVEMASSAELTLLCYKGSIKHLKQIIDFWEEKKPNEIHEKLVTVQAILEELLLGLNGQVGDVARNLASLYEYMLRRLIDSNLKKDPQPAREVLEMFKELRDTWEEAMEQPPLQPVSSKREG